MSKSEETLASIKEVTYRLIAELGIPKTTYSIIAHEVGIAKPSIYYYFKSKDYLVEAVFDELCKAIQFSSFFEINDFNKDNFMEKLIQIGITMIDEQDKDPYYNRVLQEYMLMAARNESYRDKLLTIQREYLLGFEILLDKAKEFELVAPQNLTSKAHILALVLDNIGNFMMLDEKVDYKQIWMESVHSIFRGSDKLGG